MKKCGRCKELKAEYEFRKQSKSKTGLQNYCKLCTDKYNAEWRYNNPTKAKAGNRRRHINPNGRFNSYKSNAKTKNRPFNLTFDEFMTFWQQPCFYCGSHIETIGLDRIKNEIGYELHNVVSCCEVCNSMKSSLSQQQFLDYCTKISERHQVKTY